MVDAPLFEPAADATAAVTSPSARAPGPPCTTPSPRRSPSSLDRFDTDPGDALAYAYDIVCNGNEIGGGSIRIHRRDVQERVFEVMGLTEERGPGEVRLPAGRLRSTARRRTAASRSAGTASARCSPARDSIREVIAFPKSGGGYDPLTGAPAPITAEQRKEAGVDVVAVPRPAGGLARRVAVRGGAGGLAVTDGTASAPAGAGSA